MKEKSRRFKAVDVSLLILMILPLAFGIVLKVLFTPASEGIKISGALIYTTLKMPFGELPITESQINSWLVILSVFFLCLYITHGITKEGGSHRQYFAEWIIEKTENLVHENMGGYFKDFAPFAAAFLSLSVFSSLLSLLGLYPPTSDLNVVAGWAVLVFILITYYKCKCGLLQYLKSFTEPVPFLAPLNIISEVATPVSMAFRHYGNVLYWLQPLYRGYPLCCLVGCPVCLAIFLFCRSAFQLCCRYILMCSADACRRSFLQC